MKVKIIIGATALLVSLLVSPLLAQQEGTKEEAEKGKIAKYERKSISYFKTYYQVSMDQRHQEVLEKGIRGAVELGRFDYNAVPIEVENINDLANLIAKYVDQVKLNRAKAQGREDYRFKEKLVTGADLERIINSAYIYTPTVTKFQMERITKAVHDMVTGQTTTKNFWKATVGADVTFYHVTPQYDANGQIDNVQLSVLKTISEEATQDKEITIINPEEKAKWGAFDSAVNNPFLGLARQIQVELRKIAEFQLAAQVQSSNWNSIEFEFGKQSDVALDEGYKVYEEVAGKGQSYLGYVKVRKVGDEKASPPVSSRAQKIISKDTIEAGTQMKEYPQLLVNGYLRFGTFTLEKVDSSDSGETSTAFGPILGVEYDVARFVEIPEVWLRVEGHLGVKPGDDDDLFYFLGGQAGIVKKFYLRRLGLEIGAMGGYSRMAWTSTGDSAYQNQYGITGFGGLELLLAPWLALNGEFGYRYFTYSDWMNNGSPSGGPGYNVQTKGLIMNFGFTGMF